jgi:GT2 family glycosyltransferase
LVQFFTALGFGTGFSLEESLSGVDDVSHAGLEKALVDEANPYVIKSPWFANHLAEALRDKSINIYAALVPIRDLFSAAESRRRVYRQAGQGLDAASHLGSLWETDRPQDQEGVLARQFYKTIFPLFQSEVPVYFPEFPRLIRDPDYLFRTLKPLMSDHGVGYSEFLRAHGTAARPELIHDFGDLADGDQVRPLALPEDIVRPIAFETPDRLTDVDSWHGHIPFAFWIVEALAPRVLVELGTQKGDSYCAFCQAVGSLRLATTCCAVDTWLGDEHAGFYGEEVFEELRQYHEARYQRFSRLIRSSFDDAVNYFVDGSIDLLHIDGLHTYNTVKHDFESWRPKLSSRAVVLFHDITVRESDFGVWRLWKELIREYPSFTFSHSHGLGVLAVGSDLADPIRLLTSYGDAEQKGTRVFFSRLGAAIAARAEASSKRDAFAAADAGLLERDRQDAELTQGLTRAEKERDDALARLAARIESEEARAALTVATGARDDARTALADVRCILSEKERLNTELVERASRAEAQRDEAGAESSRMAAALQLINAKNQELRTAEQAILAESESLKREIESRKLELESLRSENEALRPIAQRHEAWNAALGAELHTLWNSWSWRMLKPLRNLARKARGFDKETPQTFQSESEPLRTIIAIRQSISWELLAPVRLIHRILPRRRRSAAAHPIPVNPGAGSRPAADIGAALVGKPATEHGDAKEITKQAFATQLSDFLDADSVISLPRSERPDVSIILVLYNQAPLTFGCLCSIVESLGKSPLGVEVIIADNGSTDRTAELLRKVEGATVLRNETNLGFLKAVNQAAAHAKGNYILLLNNDAQLIPGSLEAATRVLEANTDVGAVGGRLILPDGTLQEAGSIVWQDGSTVGYGRGDQPTAPAYMFRREVDYCSGAFLLTSRELFKQLGGFDSAFVPAYYEEADYCMRLWESGFRVVYEPDAVVLHYEFGSSEQTGSALDLQRAHREVFAQKHADKLQSHLAPLVSNLLSARTAGAKRKRILMLEDGIPHTQLGSGYPRSKRIVEELVAAGALVTLFPTVGLAEEWREVRSDVSPEVEVMLGHSIADLEQFLDQRRSFYGAVMVCRPHNMESFLALIGRRPELLADATLIYDAEALFAERDILERQLLGDPLEQAAGEAILAQEASLAGQAKLVLSVSARECAEFRRLGVGRVELLGHTIEPSPGCAVFAQRRDLLFVGRLTEERSPNVDGLAWFAQEILPVIRRNLGSEVVLKVVGKLGASSMSNLNCPSVALLGQVRDLAPIYDRARVFIAPTRYAAGVPLKVYEAAAHGVPSVVTPLLAEQLGWCDEKELLVGHDRDSFADQCSRLYRDEVLWTRIRENALDRVRKDCDPVGFRRTIDQIIDATRSS